MLIDVTDKQSEDVPYAGASRSLFTASTATVISVYRLPYPLAPRTFHLVQVRLRLVFLQPLLLVLLPLQLIRDLVLRLDQAYVVARCSDVAHFSVIKNHFVFCIALALGSFSRSRVLRFLRRRQERVLSAIRVMVPFLHRFDASSTDLVGIDPVR